MQRSKQNSQFVDTLTELATAATSAVTMIHSLLEMANDGLGFNFDEESLADTRSTHKCHAISDDRPKADSASYSVCWRGKTCFLGNNLPFRLFERLVRWPNRFFSHDELLNEVWQGCRSPDAVRSVVKVLRRKLREAGMEELASAINGTVRNHLALTLDRKL